MTQEKNKVIYILSNAHAGSTITDILLGQSDNLVSCGQLCDVIFLRQKIHKSEEVQRFWEPILKDEEFDNSESTLKSAVQFYKEKAIFKAIFNTGWSKKHKKTYENLYRLIYKHKGDQGNVLVDSSKNTTHAIALSRSKEYDIHFLHIIKTPESFIDSINWRRKETDQKPVVFHSYMRWAVKAFLQSVVLKAYAKKYMKIKYSDLSNFKENGVMDRIEEFVGEDLTQTKNALAGEQMKKLHFAFSGNRIVGKQYNTFRPYENKEKIEYSKSQLRSIRFCEKNPITRFLYT